MEIFWFEGGSTSMKNPEPYVTKPLLEKVVRNANKLVSEAGGQTLM